MSTEKNGAQQLFFAAIEELFVSRIRAEVEPLMREQTRRIEEIVANAKPIVGNPAQLLGRALTLQQIQEQWNASPKTLRKKIASGELRARFVMGKYVVSPEDWQAYMAESKPKARRAAPKRMDSVEIASRAESLMTKLGK